MSDYFGENATGMMGETQQLMSLKPGTIISGRYEVVKCLGAGSMGLVYACRHIELAGQLVAVKVLFPEVAQDKVAAARFRNEIQAAYGVSHPNVVRAYEFIRDGNMLAYTMEFVGGGDIAEKLSDPSKLMPIDEILTIVIQMCLGVQAIHDAGIVHRDLKPENILLSKDGQVKIADFGIAKAGDGPRLTEHGGVVGTIDYVSPEYMLNAQVDWRSDIYAMGVLLYEMLTGVLPFKADSMYATMTKRLKTDPTEPSKLRVGCPLELDRITEKAMRRDPEMRYQSASEMGQDLIEVYRDLGYESKFVGVKPLPRATINKQSVTPSSTDARQNVPNTSQDESKKHHNDYEAVTPRSAATSLGEKSRDSSSHTQSMKKSNLLNPPDAAQTVLMDISSQQMESVLSGKVSVFDSWDKPEKGRPSKVGGAKGLARNSTSKKRSLLPDIITILVAIVVGVAVGLVVLRVFAPEVLSRWKIIENNNEGIESTSN